MRNGELETQIPTLIGEDASEDALELNGEGLESLDQQSEEDLIHALITRKSTVSLSLSEEDEKNLVNRILRDFQDAAASTGSAFQSRMQDLLKTWRTVVEDAKSFPFDGAANIRVPLSSSFVEQTKSRIYKALLGGDRIAQFSSLDEAFDRLALEELNDWFQYELTEVVDIKEAFLFLLHYTLVFGIGLGVPSYERIERPLYSSREFDIVDGQGLSDQLESILKVMFPEEGASWRRTGLGVYKATTRAAGSDPTTATISFRIENEQIVAECRKPEVLFDGVKVDTINIEDIVVINSATRIDKLSFFGSRLWLSVFDFMSGVEQGIYRSFSSDDLSTIKASSALKQSEFISQQITDESDSVEETQSKDVGAVDYARRWLEVYRWEGKWNPKSTAQPIDATIQVEGDEIDVVVWMAARSRRIIKICRIEEVNKDGHRTPVKFDYIVQPDRFFSIGLVEWLQHLQTELDGIHNQRLDAGLLSNVPFGFYTPAAGMPSTTFRVAPGMMYPIKDASGVVFPKLNWQPFWSFQEEMNVKRWAQEQAGLSENSVGAFPSKRTSASEFSGTMAQVDLRTELIVDGMLRSLRNLLYRIFGLYQQFARDGRVYEVTGLEGEKVVKFLSKDRLNGRVKLHLTGNIQQLSADLERQVSLDMLSILMNPILFQMAIVKPDTIYAAIAKLVKLSNYRGVPLHQPDVGPESDPPEVEHKRMLLGETVQPSPTENFSEHLAAHMQLAAHPKIEIYMPDPAARARLASHIQQTTSLQQAVSLMRQQQAAMAAQMQGRMAEMGIRPGLVGGQQAGDQAEPGTPEEGVMPEMGPPAEGA